MDTFTVLVVEDNPDDSILISEFLAEDSNCEFKVEVTTSLADAIIAINNTFFDAVLLDLSLPDSTGLETVRQMVSQFPEVAVLVLTGLSDDKTAIQAVKYGAQDYLEKKNISSMWLGRAIRYAIERKSIIRQKETLLADLGEALDKIEMLQNIIPICAHCKKIRNDKDEWESVEQYLAKRAGTDFSHSVCPDCVKILYPFMSKKE
jgi:DNA-binding response OmpR family regulator